MKVLADLGMLALAGGDGTRALEHARQALAIDANDERARQVEGFALAMQAQAESKPALAPRLGLADSTAVEE